jgi:maleylpyruvate isomerase
MAGTRTPAAEEERVDSDPDRLRARIDAATGRLAATAAGLTDVQAREPSRLPAWSRGHVLTHLARNADGLRNLLIWARTGVETPQYPSQQAREAGIEAGADRAAAALAQDVEQSAAAFAAEAATLPPAAWQAPVRGRNGPEHPAWFTLVRRLGEVEIHHADLGAGYAPPDWPAPFVADQLERAAGQFAGRDDVPACVIEVAGTGQRFAIGPASAGQATGAVTVAGPGCWLLAWLIGRDAGAALSVSGGPAGPGQEPAAGHGALPPKLPTWG